MALKTKKTKSYMPNIYVQRGFGIKWTSMVGYAIKPNQTRSHILNIYV